MLHHLHQVCLPDNKSSTHSYVSPSTIRSSARSASWIVPSHYLHLKTLSYPRQVTTHPTEQLVNPFYILCTEFACTPFPQTPQGHFPEFTIIFPPLLPTITLDFPAFTFNPLSRRLALHSATRLPSCSIVGAIITRSSTYSNSEGRPLLASLETTSMTEANNSGLTHDANQPSLQNFYVVQHLF